MSYPKLTPAARRRLVEAPFPTTYRVPGKTHAGVLIRDVNELAYASHAGTGDGDSNYDSVTKLEDLLERLG